MRRPRAVLICGSVLAALVVGACATPSRSDERLLVPGPTVAAPIETVPSSTVAPVAEVTTTTSPPTTTTTVVDTSTSSIASTVAAAAVHLAPDGLGVAAFGADAATEIAALTAELGAPAVDSGWVDALSSPFGVCPGALVRSVRWGPLRALFTDPGGGGVPTLFTYVFAGDLVPPGEPSGFASGLRTPEGVGLGTTITDLRVAYPELIVTTDIYGPTFLTSIEEGLSGTLTSEADDGFVTSIVGGTPCGE